MTSSGVMYSLIPVSFDKYYVVKRWCAPFDNYHFIISYFYCRLSKTLSLTENNYERKRFGTY